MPREVRNIPDQSSPDAMFSLASIAVLVIVGTLAYSNSLYGPFVFDDLDEIADNPHVQITTLGWAELRDAAWRSPSARRPVANVTFALNYYHGRLQTAGYHVVNLAVHLGCAALVYFLGLATFSRANGLPDQAARPTAVEWMALVAALLFVCHPLQVQAVTYIVQRMTSLATLFYLAALLLYIRGRIAAERRRRGIFWGAGVVCWLGSLGCKEIAVTWPGAVLLYEWFFFQDLGRQWLKACLRVLAPIVVLLLTAAVVAGGDQLGETLFGTYSLRDFTMGERVLTELRVLVFYLSLLLWPAPGRLSLTHDFAISRSLFDPITTILSLALLIGLLVFAIRVARRYRVVSFGILWFFLQLALESSVLPLELAYEHRMYLPMIGISLLAAWSLFAAAPSVMRAMAIACPVIALLAIATHARNEAWRDAPTLWADIVTKYPEDPRAHNNLGQVLAQRGDFTGALSHLRRAIEQDPKYAEAYYNIAVTKAVQGDVAAADAHYCEALAADPTYFPAYNNLGALLASQGKEAEAVELFRRAIEINPDFAPAHNNLGNALVSQGNSTEAMEHYRRALEIDPRIPDAHFSLGALLAVDGKYAEAKGHYRQALALARSHGQQSLARMIEAALETLPPANP